MSDRVFQQIKALITDLTIEERKRLAEWLSESTFSVQELTNAPNQAVYEVWSPEITTETARILQDMLKEDKEKNG